MTPNLFTPVRYTVTTFEAEIRAERRKEILRKVALMFLIMGNVFLAYGIVTGRVHLKAQGIHAR